MPKVPYSYEVNGKLVTGNGSLIPICSLLPSLTVFCSKSTFLGMEETNMPHNFWNKIGTSGLCVLWAWASF